MSAPAPRDALKIRPAAWAAGLIIVAVAAVYANSLSAPFVFDDQFAIAENPTIRHLSHLGAVLSPPAYAAGAAGRPLVNLTLAINYALGGLNPHGYHVFNLGLHLLAALTLFGIVRRTLRSTEVALAAALVWAVHPLLTESVTCVIQRDEVLGGLCYLITLYAFIRGTEPGGRPLWLGLTGFACLLGMTAKEMVVSAPILVFLYDRTFGAGTFRAALRERRWLYLSLAGTWLPLAFLMLTSEHRGGTVGFGLGVSAWDYLLTQCRAIGLYLRLSFWPHPLVIDYGTDMIGRAAEVVPQGLGLVFLAAATVAGIVRRWPASVLGAAFFLILAPSSSVVPLVTQPIAEHRMYLPLAVVVILVVAGLQAIAGRRSLLLWPLIVMVLGFLTVQRNAEYHDEANLWRGALAANPRNDRADLNLGTLAFQRGRAGEAIADYEAALRLAPDTADIHYDLAAVLDDLGRESEAIAQYREAVRLRPSYPVAQYHLGLALLKSGQPEAALGPLAQALALQPASGPARRDLARVRRELGNARARDNRMAQAIDYYEAALQLEPEDAPTLNNLANALSQLGRAAEAIAAYEAAVRARPDYAEAQYNLATELRDAGRDAEAKVHFAAALRLRPSDDQARLNLLELEARDQK
jgi:tetratricopeptide (TPR) repeat protein